jgi:hypothetical protein
MILLEKSRHFAYPQDEIKGRKEEVEMSILKNQKEVHSGYQFIKPCEKTFMTYNSAIYIEPSIQGEGMKVWFYQI